MKSYKFTNENGNVAVKVRNALKESMISAIKADMEKRGFSTSISADGEVAVYIANDATTKQGDSECIYAFIGATISKRDPAVKTAKTKSKSKKKNEDNEPMPDLFGSEGE